MIAKVLDYVKKYRMIEEKDTIIAGVSGGADSVCLLFMLLQIREKIPFRLAVVHVNHGIREDSGEDADYVRGLCAKYELPFHLTEIKLKDYAKEEGLSEEEAGRKIRYQAFEAALREELSFCDTSKDADGGKIAVAHNSNDRAETMLFHLFRGTGLTGLAGIKPVNGKIIRPLLCLTRREIEDWLIRQKIPYQTDSTNASDIYTRNKIRHHILPYAEEEICQRAISHMNRTADDLLEAEDFIKKQTLLAKEKCISYEKEEEELSIKIDISLLFEQEEYLQRRILLSCLEDITKGRKDITSVHIADIRKLFQGTGSGEIHLPYGVTVYRKYNVGMMIEKREKRDKDQMPEQNSLCAYQIFPPCSLRIPGLGNVEFTIFPYEKTENIPQKTYTKWFDYDKITRSIVFRVRETGDYLTINKEMDRKSLKDYFINEKIPKEERKSFYVLAENSHILWVPGYRISEYYKVSENTLHVLQVRVVNRDHT